MDNDLALAPLKRVQLSLQSVSALPTDVITWNNIFVQLNEAQTAGFDVVHPVIEVVIDDPTALDHLRQGGGLQFSVGIGPAPVAATIPANIFELKVENLELELIGASATGVGPAVGPALRSLDHGAPANAHRSESAGHRVHPVPPRRGVQPPGRYRTLSAAIPAQPQSNVDPGPPFSFWGRGALADWTLFLDASATALDLTALSAVKFTIGCIGLVPQGTVSPWSFAYAEPVPVSARKPLPPPLRELPA